MPPLARTTGVAGVAAGLGLAVAAGLPGVSQAPPAVVTSDTQGYCQLLSDKLGELVRIAPRPPNAEVFTLAGEGRHLCSAGQVRGGILRLRRGVMLMLRDLDERGEP